LSHLTYTTREARGRDAGVIWGSVLNLGFRRLPVSERYGVGLAEAAAEAVGALDADEAVGPALCFGMAPAPELSGGEETGEGRDAVVGAGEGCGAACDFISSRRKALSPVVLLWA